MLIKCPWTLFESKFDITFSISFSVNIFDKDLLVVEYRDVEEMKFLYFYLWKIIGMNGVYCYSGKI